jgi:hypothetical protein
MCFEGAAGVDCASRALADDDSQHSHLTISDLQLMRVMADRCLLGFHLIAESFHVI